MKSKNVAKECYKEATKQKFNLLTLDKFVPGRKTFIKEFDLQCRCSRKDVVAMKYTFGVRKYRIVET